MKAILHSNAEMSSNENIAEHLSHFDEYNFHGLAEYVYCLILTPGNSTTLFFNAGMNPFFSIFTVPTHESRGGKEGKRSLSFLTTSLPLPVD